MKAEVLDYNKRWAWLRIPKTTARSHYILTVPRDVLKRGMASATLVEANISDIRHDEELGWTAEVEITDVLERRDATGT